MTEYYYEHPCHLKDKILEDISQSVGLNIYRGATHGKNESSHLNAFFGKMSNLDYTKMSPSLSTITHAHTHTNKDI